MFPLIQIDACSSFCLHAHRFRFPSPTQSPLTHTSIVLKEHRFLLDAQLQIAQIRHNFREQNLLILQVHDQFITTRKLVISIQSITLACIRKFPIASRRNRSVNVLIDEFGFQIIVNPS